MVDRVGRGFRVGLLMSLCISGATSIAVIAFGHGMVSLFNSDPQVVAAGARYLMVVGSFYTVFGTMFVVNGVLRGAGEAVVPLLNTILALWMIRIPCALWFSSFAGETGVWWSIPTGWIVGCAFALIYYAGGRWKRRIMPHPEAALEEELECQWVEK